MALSCRVSQCLLALASSSVQISASAEGLGWTSSTFEGTVSAYTSHGAHIDVDGMLCHVPLRNLGDPAPLKARQVLAKGETRTFSLISVDAPRRRAEVALVG